MDQPEQWMDSLRALANRGGLGYSGGRMDLFFLVLEEDLWRSISAKWHTQKLCGEVMGEPLHPGSGYLSDAAGIV